MALCLGASDDATWSDIVKHLTSDVLAWLGLEANGFGLALGGFGFWDPQAKP